jgi:hypothetical protein
MGGLKCHACRRFVLRRWHVAILIIIAVAAVVGLVELIGFLTPPPLKSTH